jgi:hypothetical protein
MADVSEAEALLHRANVFAGKVQLKIGKRFKYVAKKGWHEGVAMKGMRWSLIGSSVSYNLQHNLTLLRRDGTNQVAKGVHNGSADISLCRHCREGTASGS